MALYEQHPSIEKMCQLSEGILPDFEQVALEAHLGECDECLGLWRRMDGLLDSGFTANAHAAVLEAEARAADPLVNAIRAASGLYRDLAAVLREWLDAGAALWGDAPVRRLGQIGLLPVSGREVAQPIRVQLLHGESRAEITLRESGQTLEIESDAPAGAVALLFLTGEKESVHAATLQSVGETRLARFERIPAGNYRLAIGPAVTRS
jgi:hypothetical protein